MLAASILLVDDEEQIRTAISRILQSEHHDVTTVGSGAEALEWAERKPFDLMLTDVKMSQMNGLELMKKVSRIQPDIVTVLITGYGSLETARAAIKGGAYDYIQKPAKAEEIKLAVKDALERRILEKEYAAESGVTGKTRDEFISAISHELRTPLTSVYTSLRLVSEGSAGKLPKQAKRLSDIAYGNSERLVVLINKRLRQLAGLLKAGETIAVTIESDTLFESILDLALEQTNSSAGSLMLLDDETSTLEPVATRSLPNGGLPQIKESLESRIADQAILKRTADSVTVAIKTPKKVLGVLSVSGKCKSETFTDSDMELLLMLSSHAAIAIENTMLFKKLNETNVKLRESQEELENWNKKLGTEVTKRTEALSKANNELAEANEYLRELDKEKTKFLNTVAHDLRTPLTSIRAYADMVLMYKDEPTEVYEEFLKIIIQESDRVANLISNLLNLAKIESDTIEYEKKPVDLHELIDHFVSVYAAQTRPLGISLTSRIPEDLPEVIGDKDGLGQVITNLLDNAVKFTPSGGEIHVEVMTSDSASDVDIDDGEICVCVSDTGIGIDRNYHDKIFDRFGRAGVEGETVKEGVGLGLAIARHIVNCHGGRIWVESEEGKGSRFLFVIPQ